MDMTMSSIRPNRVEVVTSVQRRRRWTPEQKFAASSSLARVAVQNSHDFIFSFHVC
jgi:hypothetical protein